MEAWMSVVGSAAFSAAAYTLTAKAERHTTPVVAACYNTLQPVIALAVMTALGEAPGARNLVGSGLIVLGGLAAVALSTHDRRQWKRVAAEVAAAAAAAMDGGAGAGVEGEEEGGGTVRRRRGGDGGEEEAETTAPTPTGTVRMIKVPGPGTILGGYGYGSRDGANKQRRPKLGTMVWTVAWALVMSLCALAGGGFLTWSLVYLYWKYLC